MGERTFSLNRSFGEELFNRFLETLAHLKSDARAVIEMYDRVTVDDIATFVETAFWASQTPEEGRYHNFRVSLGPPAEWSSDYLFSEPKPYSPGEISDLAVVLAKTYKSLGVWYSPAGSLEIWGIAHLPHWDIQVFTRAPGQLLFSMLGGQKSFAVALSGSWWGFVDKARVPITWAYFGGMRPATVFELDVDLLFKARRRSKTYESIAKSMLGHKHGGTLIILPESHQSWRNSIASVRYTNNVFEGVSQNVDESDKAFDKHMESGKLLPDGYTEHVRVRAMKSLEFVAQLTAVDGATLLGRDLAIYGFGAKLKPLNSNDKPEHVRVSRPFEGSPFELIKVTDLGGTRHQSAAQFVYDQRDCVAVVCSQDGRLSALTWDPTHNSVLVITNLEYAL